MGGRIAPATVSRADVLLRHQAEEGNHRRKGSARSSDKLLTGSSRHNGKASRVAQGPNKHRRIAELTAETNSNKHHSFPVNLEHSRLLVNKQHS